MSQPRCHLRHPAIRKLVEARGVEPLSWSLYRAHTHAFSWLVLTLPDNQNELLGERTSQKGIRDVTLAVITC